MEDIIRNNSLDEGLDASRLPIIDEDEKNLIRGTSDFFFLNYYTSAYVEPGNTSTSRIWATPSFRSDANVFDTQNENWPVSASFWLRSIPEGLRGLLK